jgi:hypothetical protein
VDDAKDAGAAERARREPPQHKGTTKMIGDPMGGAFAEDVENYIMSRGMHRAGGLARGPLTAIERHCRNPSLTMETGCGASTILMSRISPKHYSFCVDDRTYDNSSVNFVTEAPLYCAAHSTFVFGPTQQTLPAYRFDGLIDFALIDGPHSFPFPELEYYAIYPKLKVGAVLAVDDVHIPTIHNLFRFLSEEVMFELIERTENLALFRRTAAPTFDPLGDDWEAQVFNRRRFPVLGREERWARLVPKWLTHLFPPTTRAAAKRFLARV